MDLLKSSKRRSALSTVVYNALNVGLAVAILVVVQTAGSPLPAMLLVLLSKWRVLAVRPRYWAANIQANLVDLIVSISYVVFLYGATESLWLQIVLTLLYIAWLLILKPKSRRTAVVSQAGVAVFVGVTALFMVSYAWPVSLVVLVMWLIGYASARHVLGAYSEMHTMLLSLVWGLVIAELGWLTYHWAFAYDLPGFGDIMLSQAAVFALAISFLAERTYAGLQDEREPLLGKIILPLLLCVSVITVLLLVFNEVSVSL